MIRRQSRRVYSPHFPATASPCPRRRGRKDEERGWQAARSAKVDPVLIPGVSRAYSGVLRRMSGRCYAKTACTLRLALSIFRLYFPQWPRSSGKAMRRLSLSHSLSLPLVLLLPPSSSVLTLRSPAPSICISGFNYSSGAFYFQLLDDDDYRRRRHRMLVSCLSLRRADDGGVSRVSPLSRNSSRRRIETAGI